MEIENQYKSLVESLRILALPYEEQRSCLPNYVIVQDEVIAMFDDAFLLLPQIIDAEFLDKKSIASIIRCFNWMNIMTRNNEIDVDFLKNNDGWQKVRYLATQALTDIKELKGKLDISHIDWISD